jgi:uncharacterized protein (TIGR02145 family)
MKKILTILFAVALGPASWGQSDCPEPLDSNQDGYIGVEDLMNLLSYFGDSDSDLDGIFDSVDLCVDPQACNYISNPTEACIFLDAIGVCNGDCAEDTDGDGVCDVFYGPCQGESTLTYQDYTYDLVAIGEQCWFAENLRSDHYANGDVIPGDLSQIDWVSTNTGAQAVEFGNADFLANYGRLYNWYAIDDSRGVCPSGWHVPTDGEFMTLEMELGMSELAANAWAYRGTDQGYQMKSSPTDSPSWNGANTSGFSGLAGGYRNGESGIFYDSVGHGYFWSSTLFDDNGIYRRLDNAGFGVFSFYTDKDDGLSVRCVRD